jgi:hypothetical protein
VTPSQGSPDFAGGSRFDGPFTVVVEEADALDLLLELNAAPGIDAEFAEKDPAFDEAKEHPAYSLDFLTVAELVVALTSSLTTLSTALIAYRSKKLAQAREQGQPTPAVAIYINGQQVQLAAVDTTASLEEKLRVSLETDRQDAN